MEKKEKQSNQDKKKNDDIVKNTVKLNPRLEEGINDPGIFKAVFLAGGPGSGKSFMVGKTALTALGLKLINSDPAFEAQLKKVGLKPTPEDIFTPAGQSAREKAKRLTAMQQKLALNGRLGLVIDGTGKDYDNIAQQSQDLKKLGYDVAMIFVNTNLETAISRDANRDRTLGAKQVTKMWNQVQDNIGKFQSLFGQNMIIVDNSEGADWQKGSTDAYKKMSKWVARPPSSPMAKKWIDSAKSERGITGVSYTNPRLEEETGSTAVFTFGRMNPPTIGHEKLVNKIDQIAKQNNAMPHIYLSHSYDSKKNPLPYKTKIALAKRAFGKSVTQSSAKTVFQVVKELEQMGHKKLIMVVGSDRVNEFRTILNKYNGKDYNFESIEVVSAGERDPDAEGAEGMSASKMRLAVQTGDEVAFKTGLPKKLQSSAKAVFKSVKDGMDIAEEMEAELGEEFLQEVLTLAQRRKRALVFRRSKSKIMRGRRIAQGKMASGDKLKKRARRAAIRVIRRKVAGDKGANYANLSPGEKEQIDKKVSRMKGAIAKIASRQMINVRKAERARFKAFKARGRGLSKIKENMNDDLNIVMEAYFKVDDEPIGVDESFENLFEREDKDIGDRKGSQPTKYYTGLAKSTKQKRDAQFKKAAEKDSGDPSAYPEKHIGDTDVKTKTSVHTKRYHQMFSKENTMKHDSRFRFNKKITEEKELFKEIDHMLKDITDDLFEQMIQEKSLVGLKRKAEKSGIPYNILKKVYDRGMAAWRTGHRPGASQEQWAYARVNSFITKGKGTWGKADADLAREVTGEEIEYDTPATGRKPGRKTISWRTDGHYLENGEEWHGDQHAYEGEVYTGAEHGPDSKRLYHYKELPSNLRAKIDAALKEDKEEEVAHDKCGTPECCGQCDIATGNLNEKFTDMINDTNTIFATKFSEVTTVKGGFDLHPDSDVDESSIHLMLNKNKYKKAAELVKNLYKKDKSHSIGYWAHEVIRTNNLNLDIRTLVKVVNEEHDIESKRQS